MFGGSRRRRPPGAPLNSATADPNATTAAASAFMSAANQNPNKALSSAAAAAALRARPHTPTNVAEVQTKRTTRRSASVSSSGNAPAGARPGSSSGQLERRGSMGSMRERTFRSPSPSPHRPSAPATREPEPPVPEIPDSHRTPMKNSRAIGVGMQNFRTASQKMRNDPSSWYVQPAGDISNVRTSDSIMRDTKSPPPTVPNNMASQSGRPESRNSVNFSYPTAFRPQSPPASPTSPSRSHVGASSVHPATSAVTPSRRPSSSSRPQGSQQLVYDPNSRRMVSRARLEEAVEYQIKSAADKPAKRRKDSTPRREGSQLSKGTVGRARGAIIGEDKNSLELPKREQPVVEALRGAKGAPLGEEPEAKAAMRSQTFNSVKPTQLSIPRASNPSQDSTSSTHHSSSEPKKHPQPSHSTPVALVQDGTAANDEGPKTEIRATQAVLDALDAIPTRQTLFEDPGPSQSTQKQSQSDIDQASRPPPTAEVFRLSEASNERTTSILENKPVVSLAGNNDGLSRSHSNSPARQARFAPGPTEKLAVRHAPLPRSASPIKSAMKHNSPTLRGSSPPDNVSDPSGSPSGQKEDPAVSRKKSVRVSFDDQGTIVGDAAPTAEEDSIKSESPQSHKRNWFSNIGRSKKKEIVLDDDEIMQPRPALPSFGSIRDKKIREQGERPLVRPLENSPAISSSPELRPPSSSTLNDSETTEEPTLCQSSDHAIGALLAQDQISRNAANISRFREPLPPVVTSIEGSGYSSDSYQSSEDEEHDDTPMAIGGSIVDSSTLNTQSPPCTEDDFQEVSTVADFAQTQERGFSHPEATQQNNIPGISVVQPSPPPSERSPRVTGLSTTHSFDVPGSFPNGESDLSYDGPWKATQDSGVTHSLPSSTAVSKPSGHVEIGQKVISPQTTLGATTSVTGVDDGTGDETDESIYSDAYEDIPDVESSGFLSLDTIVESPTNEKSSLSLLQASENSPAPLIASKPRYKTTLESSSVSQSQPRPPQDVDDWEQAKVFWRSLTAEKRRQLEIEAAEEAGADGDREEVAPPVRRSSARQKSPEMVQAPLPLETLSARAKPPQPEPRTRVPPKDEQTAESAESQPRIGIHKTPRPNGRAQSASNLPSRPATATKASPAAMSPAPGQHQATKYRSHSSGHSTSKSHLTRQGQLTLPRRESDASDSSFKRNQHAPSGTIALRKTMRQTSPIQPPHESTRGSGRFSLRSLSPVGSTVRRESNTSTATPSLGMKRTLRASSESSREGKRSSVHFPLFTRSNKSSRKRSGWASRFEDSSDEGEGTIPGFQSRIHDSSDEEESGFNPTTQSGYLGGATLRGSATAPSLGRPTPVLELEEDSPELPDSDDDPMPSPLQSPQHPAMSSSFGGRLGRTNSGAIGTSTLARSRSGRGGIAPSFTSPALPTKERRSSLLGSLLQRNKKPEQTGKIQRSELVDSAARRDTKLERDSGQLRNLRSDQPPSPKLQKKTSMSRRDNKGLQRPASASNLLSQSAAAGAAEQGRLSARRTFSLSFQTSNEGYEAENARVDGPGAGKKKKFGALRRIFKLDE
ncbi:hypothetical protein F4802DRAFT_39321 [Xylaria palmicola]|nr:hypothetical protein F4802DRAFT_39321 [Xylaria palmicola]